MFGIRFKVISSVAVIMIMIMMGMTLVLIEKSKEDLLMQMEKRGKILLSYLQKSVQAQSNNTKKTNTYYHSFNLQRIVELFNSDPELIELMIIGLNRRIIAHTNASLVSEFYLGEDIDTSLQPGQDKVTIEGKKKTNMVIITPLMVSGKKVGLIRAVFSLKGVMENLSISKKSTFKVIFVESIVIIIFITMLLSMMVARPIERLAKITNRIASGNLNSRIEIFSKDEFGYLANAFNRMAEELQKTHRSLENTIVSQKEAYSALKETQDHLISSEKLASVGRLAAGVAHEVGNPLSSISGYTEILSMEGISEEERLDYIHKIQHATDRIQKIIRGLLDFSRPASLELHPVNLKEVIETTIDLAAHHSALQATPINIDFPNDLPLVMADEYALSQVFLNIIINSAQAMKDNPPERTRKIIISAASKMMEAMNKTNENELIVGKSNFYRPIENVMVIASIKDFGKGIKKENINQVFDPFFTTKKSGEGTGLGLTICHTIIERFQGEIQIYSIPEQETTISVLLVAAEVIKSYDS